MSKREGMNEITVCPKTSLKGLVVAFGIGRSLVVGGWARCLLFAFVCERKAVE